METTTREATWSPEDVKEISVGAPVVALLSELDGTFTIKEEQRMALKAFSQWKGCFRFTPDRL